MLLFCAAEHSEDVRAKTACNEDRVCTCFEGMYRLLVRWMRE